MSDSRFVHLHLHSAYSLAEGAIRVKDLVKLCKAQGMPAVAVTDTNNMFGAMEFATEAAQEGVQPIIGAQISYGSQAEQLVLLVQNQKGYQNLCKLISDAYMESDGQSTVFVRQEELQAHNEGLICLSGGLKGPVGQALLHRQNEQAEQALLFLKGCFGNRLYVELQRHGLPDEARVEQALLDLAYAHDIPLVATNDCFFPGPEDHEAHDALLCIAEGRYVTEEERRKVTKEHYFKSAKQMISMFKDIPEAIENTLVISQRCSFLLEPIAPILPPFETAGGRSEFEELEAQAWAGLEWRLENYVDEGADHAPYKERMKYELGVIKGMGFPGYFLIVSDFIKWAKEQNIPVGPGRGSGAGSVVAWALKITDLDPLALGLLFERFLNPERVSMPDFDIDFCQERRDEVIRYVQEKYGYDRVAQIITFGKLQARAVVRDVGRVLQMPYGQVDRIAKLIPNNPAHPVTLQEALDGDEELRAERDKDETQKKLIDIALKLEGLYRHASTHAAGVVIGDRPLNQLIPLYRDPRSDMPVTGFNMKYVEQAGLVKFDFLGLKTMTVIQKTLDMLAERGEVIDILDVALDDSKTYELMAGGNTVGVFQLESSGMRDVLRKVRPNRFEDIIALVSLYRPGPMDNIPKYISVKENKEEADYLHPKLQPFLEETYGIMIYQEQVMQAAQTLAGYTLGGADLLRRAMGKKIKDEMDAQRVKFINGSKEHNQVPENQASSIFDQIAKFAGYGFNKSHAAAYALIAYWTAWLKANYPLEFMAASMTLDMGNTDKLAVFRQDLDRASISVLPADINYSHTVFKVEDKGIRYALGALKGVGEQAMNTLVAEREKNGRFQSIQDFAERLDYKSMNKRQIEQLAGAGAFDSITPNRARIYGAADMILRYAQSVTEERDSGQVSLFAGAGDADSALGMPDLPEIEPWDMTEQLGHEFAAVGFYLTGHPLDSREQQFEKIGVVSVRQVEAEMNHKSAAHFQMAGVLLKKQEKISQKGSKYAFLQLSDPSGVYEVTMFSDLLAASRSFLEAGTLLLIGVDVEQREEQLRFTLRKVQPLDDALESKIQAVDIYMDEAAPAAKIKKFLDIEGRGRCRVSLHVNLTDGRYAQIDLPGRWSLSHQARNIIRKEPGITRILEA